MVDGMISCKWDDCSLTHSMRRGFCGKHYARCSKMGWPEYPEAEWAKRRDIRCAWPECVSSSKIKRGLCSTHYSRSVKLGHPEKPWEKWRDGRVPSERVCVWPSCDDPQVVGRQMCSVHYHRSKRAGFPDSPWVQLEADNPPVPDGHKRCKSCGQNKPPDDFYRRTVDGGLWHRCIECNRSSSANIRAERKEVIAGYSRSYKFRKYGITESEYKAMVESQGGVCAICGGVNQDGVDLAIDHDHFCCPGNGSCGQCVRGALCRKCNSGLGMLGDDPSVLRMALQYLENSNRSI